MKCEHRQVFLRDGKRMRPRVRDAKPRVGDPSGTAPIADQFRTEVRARMARAERAVARYVENSGTPSRREMTRIINKAMGGSWHDRYTKQSYKSGLDRAAQLVGATPPKGLSRADRAAIADISDDISKQLKDVAKETAAQIAEVAKAADTIEDALSGVAGRMKAIGVTRGEAVAAVNTIGTNADATLAAFEEAGVEYVGVEAEKELTVAWLTAGDDEVCEDCEAMEGQAFSLEEATGMIPLHPNCRCAWIPLEFEIVFEGAQK
jgi:hypothetical protein